MRGCSFGAFDDEEFAAVGADHWFAALGRFPIYLLKFRWIFRLSKVEQHITIFIGIFILRTIVEAFCCFQIKIGLTQFYDTFFSVGHFKGGAINLLYWIGCFRYWFFCYWKNILEIPDYFDFSFHLFYHIKDIFLHSWLVLGFYSSLAFLTLFKISRQISRKGFPFYVPAIIGYTFHHFLIAMMLWTMKPTKNG